PRRVASGAQAGAFGRRSPRAAPRRLGTRGRGKGRARPGARRPFRQSLPRGGATPHLPAATDDHCVRRGDTGAMATPQNVPGPIKLLLTVPEAAQALGLGRSVIYELLVAGELAGVKIGRARRIPVRSLEAFIARRMAKEMKREQTS